jgi:hypothetical protein
VLVHDARSLPAQWSPGTILVHDVRAFCYSEVPTTNARPRRSAHSGTTALHRRGLRRQPVGEFVYVDEHVTRARARARVTCPFAPLVGVSDRYGSARHGTIPSWNLATLGISGHRHGRTACRRREVGARDGERGAGSAAGVRPHDHVSDLHDRDATGARALQVPELRLSRFLLLLIRAARMVELVR